MQQLRYLDAIVRTNVKYIFTNKLTMLTLVFFMISFIGISTTLNKELAESSSIPVGILDLDQSEMSRETVGQLKEMEGFTIYELPEKDLEKALLEERILAYFVINDKFENSIKANNLKNIVKMYYLKDYNYISVVSDIFSKAIMYNVILYRGNVLYEKIGKQEGFLSLRNYVAYTTRLKEQSKYSFTFAFDYYKIGNNSVHSSKETENNLISSQLFIGVLTIFTSFLVMFLVMCIRKSDAIQIRLRTCMVSNFMLEVGNVVTLLLIELVVSIFFTLHLCTMLGVAVAPNFVWILMQQFSVFFVFTFLFLIISQVVESEIVYQGIGTAIILVFGGISILQAIGQLNLEIIVEYAKNIPNYWFIIAITDIILAGSTSMSIISANMIGMVFLLYCVITMMKYRYIVR